MRRLFLKIFLADPFFHISPCPATLTAAAADATSSSSPFLPPTIFPSFSGALPYVHARDCHVQDDLPHKLPSVDRPAGQSNLKRDPHIRLLFCIVSLPPCTRGSDPLRSNLRDDPTHWYRRPERRGKMVVFFLGNLPEYLDDEGTTRSGLHQQ